MPIVSVSLPEALVDQMDELIAKRGFAGRSELVRAALRDFVTKELQTETGKGKRSATLTLLYPEGNEKRIADVRHDYNEIVKSMMHAHTETHCVEVFILHGNGARIRDFVDRLRAHKDTQLVQATYTDLETIPSGAHPNPHDHT